MTFIEFICSRWYWSLLAAVSAVGVCAVVVVVVFNVIRVVEEVEFRKRQAMSYSVPASAPATDEELTE